MAQVSRIPPFSFAHHTCSRCPSSTHTTSNLRRSLRCPPLRAAIATPKTYPSMPAASATGAMVSAAASVISVLAASRAGARVSFMVRTRSGHPHNPPLFFQSNQCSLDPLEPLERERLPSSRRRRELWERLPNPWSHHLLHWPWLDPPNPLTRPCP